jgi:hypothetical protein
MDDLAYRTGYAEADVVDALEGLLAMDLVEVECVCDHIFYRLHRDLAVLKRLEALFAWQEQWQVQLERLGQMVG